MKAWQISGVILIVASAYLALASEIEYRHAHVERCSVVHCS